MVSFKDVEASNARIASTLHGLVAVFVGGTSGIGEYTLKQFARYTPQPRAYFIGRSQEAADRITKDLIKTNAQGEYIFIKADTSLIRTVDQVCEEIKSKENFINILFITAGTLVSGTDTSEGLHTPAALSLYARHRFTTNLLPLLENAPSIRRVIGVFCGGKEGPIDTTDFQCRGIPLMKARGHGASMVTLSMKDLARQAPTVTFIHDFPGFVKTKIGRGPGFTMFMIRSVSTILSPLMPYIPNEESGERHLFLATSAMFAAGGDGQLAGVPLEKGLAVAKTISEGTGGAMFVIDERCDSAGPSTGDLMGQLERDGTAEKLKVNIDETLTAITQKA